jgi:hypothetical protein
MHEDFKREVELSGPSDRSFGITFAVAFAVIGVLPSLRHGSVRWWALAVSSAFLAVSVVAPSVLHQPNRWWMKLAAVLNRVMSPVVMAVVFYLAVLPVALILRMLGKDPMRVRFDRAATSYWIPRDPPGPAPQSMSRQF